jgi:WD40 repeat protein
MRWVAVLAALVLSLAAARAEEAAKGWLGVELKDVTKEEADALGLEGPRGAKVVKPVPGDVAEKAGLLPGDILLSADGVEVETMAGFLATVSGKAPGEKIKLRLLRDGKEKRLAATLGVRLVEVARVSPRDAPILQLDTGGHMARITGLAFTPDGSQLVSASEDKLIRVWDVATGKTLRAIRGEADVVLAGKIYAMVLSPDGKWLAAAGLTDKSVGSAPCCGDIRLYDFASGELVALLKGHENVVLSLAFSPDSSRLISGSADFTSIIWNVREGKPLHRLQGHTGNIEAVGFTPDGARVVTGAFDSDLRLWRLADGAEIARMTGHGGKVRSLAFTKDGTVASGDSAGEIRLWDDQTGRFLRTLVRQENDVVSLRVSPDGNKLLSGIAGLPLECHVYDVASGRELIAYRGHENIVLATAISPDGRWAATGGGSNHEIHVWDLASGVRRNGPDGAPLSLAGAGRPVWAAGFSADGREIAWGNTRKSSRGTVEYALALPRGADAFAAPHALVAKAAENFHQEEWSHGDWSLSHGEGGDYGAPDAILYIIGKRIDVSIERGPADGYGHSAYTFTPDGETVISGGGGGMIIAYDLTGDTIGAFKGHEGDVWAVAPSPDGRYLVSGSDDQTMRLWNLQTRELLVTIFRGVDGEWVMWTPQGYYADSPGADKMIGWQINKGPDKAADYVTAEQLRKHLNRPDIVAKAIQLASAEEAVRTSYGTEFKLSDLLARPAPHLRVLSPEAGAPVKTSAGVNVKIALDATPDPVTRIRIQVNGRQFDDFLPEDGASFGPGEHLFPVPLAKGQNAIAVTALNEIGWSKVQDGTLTVTNETAGDLDKRGTLYILAIGVTKYPGVASMCSPKDTCDLDFTGVDASAFADAMEQRLGPLHDKVVRRVLENGGAPEDAPTAANIIDALGVLRDAGPTDTVAVFLAGHGVNDGPNYRFVSTDAASAANGALKPSSVVPWYAIEEAIDGAKGRRLLFIDTCHSANAYNQRLGNAAYYANILAYSSARWDQLSWEDPNVGHGLFTYALVEGMSGAADLNHDGRVDTAELAEYLRKRVPELAAKQKREQEPQFFKGRDAEVYPIAALP